MKNSSFEFVHKKYSQKQGENNSTAKELKKKKTYFWWYGFFCCLMQPKTRYAILLCTNPIFWLKHSVTNPWVRSSSRTVLPNQGNPYGPWSSLSWLDIYTYRIPTIPENTTYNIFQRVSKIFNQFFYFKLKNNLALFE